MQICRCNSAMQGYVCTYAIYRATTQPLNDIVTVADFYNFVHETWIIKHFNNAVDYWTCQSVTGNKVGRSRHTVNPLSSAKSIQFKHAESSLNITAVILCTTTNAQNTTRLIVTV